MVNQSPLWPPQLVAEALGTGAIPDELAAILAAHYQTVHEYRTDRMPEERSIRLIHSVLAQLASGMDLVPGLERVTAVGINPDGKVLLMHSLFSVQGQHLLDPATSLCLPGRAAR